MHISLAALLIFCNIWQSDTSVVRTEMFGVYTPAKIGRRAKRAADSIHSCDNMVYCQGDLLDTVQRKRLYADSKTFVDMSQKNAEATTLLNFNAMMKTTNNAPSKDDVQKFVDENFEFIDESENWTPTDFKTDPSFLDDINDVDTKEFALQLVSLWPLLGRRIKDSVKADPTRHSLIPVPNGFIVPGGRFREIYYWDSYWIIKGLLLSEMTTTVQGMLDNFVYLISQYGLIPNGSRLYYINRSQPPLFTLMVGLYMEHTDDKTWLDANIEYLEKELLFWLNNRTVAIKKSGLIYNLAHYGTPSNTPRPESYAEDLGTCAHCTSDTERTACYNALKTAAETGWDFSTRWIFDENGGTKANLSFIDSQRVIPVDLNAFLCKAFYLLSQFYEKLANYDKQAEWSDRANEWQKNIDLFLYNEADGIWYDYDYDLNQQRKYFFPSNFVPLWADCYDLSNQKKQGEKAVAYFLNQGIDKFMGGVPTSLEESGEQWDMPNAWPPLQEFIVLGLYNTGYQEAQNIARDFAERWIKSNMKGFENSGAMYEKYDAVNPGQYGGGGEYAVQLGFGWSNGVALEFISKFSSGRMKKAVLNQYQYLIIFSLLPFVKIILRT